MQLFIQRIFDALGNGSIYAALAVALSLVYRASGQLNFALGEASMVSTYVALTLATKPRGLMFGTWAHQHLGTPWPLIPAFTAAMVVGFLIALVVHRLLSGGRSSPRPVTAVVGEEQNLHRD